MKRRIQKHSTIRETLKSIEGLNPDGQQIDKARFHPFPARMPFCVADILIRGTTLPGAVVLDPMVGSGTTSIAASLNGRESIGIDRDPLAVLISRTSINSFDSKRLEKLKIRVLNKAENIFRNIRLPKIRAMIPRKDQEFLKYWFPWRSQKQLFALNVAIKEEIEEKERELAWVIFSSLIIAKSAGASHALDISRSKPHKRIDKKINLPFDSWNKRFNSTIKRLPYLDKNPGVESVVQLGDARKLPLEDETVDLVLTSPPYKNAIDYMRGHKFSLIWMERSLEELSELRGTMVGSERGLWTQDGLPQRLEDRLEKSVYEKRRRAHLRRYLSDLKGIFSETHRVLRPDGLAIFVVGPTLISQNEPDAVEVISQVAQSVGLNIKESTIRNLNSKRRSLPPPFLTNQSYLDRRMSYEVIVILNK